MNSGGDNHWVSFSLRGRMAIDGTGSNADAIGAKIAVSYKSASGETIVQTNEVLGSSSFLSMSSLDAHFGVATAESVDVTVEWPSGRTTVLNGVDVNQIQELIEPAS
jgi:hypothetical protein